MLTIKDLVKQFSEHNKDEHKVQYFCTNTLDKLIFQDSSLESDMRALLRRSALLKKRAAEYKSLIKDKSKQANETKNIINELSLLNIFMEYVLKQMPHETHTLSSCVSKNKSYINLKS